MPSRPERRGEAPFPGSERWLEATLQALPQGVALFDSSYRLLHFSQRLEKLAGLPSGFLSPGLALDALLRRLPVAHTDSDPLEALRSGRGLPPVLRYENADGHLLELRTGPGVDGGVVLALTDLTESTTRSQNESQLTEVLNIAPAALLVLDADDRIVLWNKPFLALNREAELEVGLPFEELLWRYMRLGDLWRIDQAAAAAVERRMAIHRDYVGPFEEWISADRALLTSEHPTADGGCIIMHVDVSERKRAERDLLELNRRLEAQAAELREANAAKSRFLANMSHELRTPLSAIIGFAELLRDSAMELPPETVAKDLEKIARAGGHLLALINDILDLSKVEAGKLELVIDEIDLVRLVREIEATVEPVIRRNANRLEIAFLTEAPVLSSDGTRVRQVLYNLLSNAAKFTREGLVTLQVSEERDVYGERFVTLLVSDTGIGLTEEQVGRLFQPFTQADAATHRMYGGTGLGLALSRRFCRLMGGDLTVTSEAGVGSMFRARVKDHSPVG